MAIKLRHISHCFTNRCTLCLQISCACCSKNSLTVFCTSSSDWKRLPFNAFFTSFKMWKSQGEYGLDSYTYSISFIVDFFDALATWGRALSWSRMAPRESFLRQRRKWKTSYSFDLSSCDFHIFELLKKAFSVGGRSRKYRERILRVAATRIL